VEAAPGRGRIARVLAGVDLDVVDAPGAVGGRVDELVVERARARLAGAGAACRVQAELQAFRVHVVCERAHAAGEASGVGHDGAVGSAFHHPAVV
jgi:hypothetical protein